MQWVSVSSARQRVVGAPNREWFTFAGLTDVSPVWLARTPPRPEPTGDTRPQVAPEPPAACDICPLLTASLTLPNPRSWSVFWLAPDNAPRSCNSARRLFPTGAFYPWRVCRVVERLPRRDTVNSPQHGNAPPSCCEGSARRAWHGRVKGPGTVARRFDQVAWLGRLVTLTCPADRLGRPGRSVLGWLRPVISRGRS